MDLNKIRYFLAVARHLGFQRASEELNVAQPAVTRAIQKLEHQLGFKLLDRTTRQVTLTRAGAVFAEDARDAFAILERSKRQARQIASGNALDIVLGYSTTTASTLASDPILKLRRRYPDATVDIVTMNSDDQVRAILSGSIDGGFMLTMSCVPPLTYKALRRDPVAVLVGPAHWAATRESIFLHELRDEPFITGGDIWRPFKRALEPIFKASDFVPHVVAEESDLLLMMELVMTGQGVALLNQSSLQGVPRKLVAVPLADDHAFIDLGFVWDPRRKLQIILDLIAEL